jgi:putative phosphoribosyl transferase
MNGFQRFSNRRQAGAALAHRLLSYAHRQDVIVLALPRGGVPVGYEIAEALAAPLDVLVVRKLGVPGRQEFAMGAIASGGLCVLNTEAIRMLSIPMAAVEQVRQREAIEIARREALYRDGRAKPELHGNTVILVDDGLATGSTMQVAVQAVRAAQAAHVVVAVPVAAPETCGKLAADADEVVCLSTPDPFYAVGLWYDDFDQTSDDEVIFLLDAAAREHAGASPPADQQTARREDFRPPAA